MDGWNRIYLVLGLGLALGCGRETSSRPPSSPESATVRRAEVIAAVFDERDTAGRRLWTLAADTVVETTPDDYRCTTVRIEILDPAGAAAASRRLLVAVGEGTRIEAASGRLRRESDVLRAEIEGGFTLTLADGWTARGEALTWDGVLLRSPARIEMTRGATRITGERAVIDPRRRRITLQSASGALHGLALE